MLKSFTNIQRLEAPDFVISQSPEPNGDLPKGSKIVLVVSQGTEFIKIPNLNGEPADAAKRMLEDRWAHR